jgi:hypothetical protein
MPHGTGVVLLLPTIDNIGPWLLESVKSSLRRITGLRSPRRGRAGGRIVFLEENSFCLGFLVGTLVGLKSLGGIAIMTPLLTLVSGSVTQCPNPSQFGRAGRGASRRNYACRVRDPRSVERRLYTLRPGSSFSAWVKLLGILNTNQNFRGRDRDRPVSCLESIK